MQKGQPGVDKEKLQTVKRSDTCEEKRERKDMWVGKASHCGSKDPQHNGRPAKGHLWKCPDLGRNGQAQLLC